jgi:hypothetical protein
MFAIGICRRALSIAIACVAISACGGRSNAAGGLAKKIGRYGTHCVPVTNAALEYHPVADGTEKTGSGLGAREPSCKTSYLRGWPFGSMTHVALLSKAGAIASVCVPLTSTGDARQQPRRARAATTSSISTNRSDVRGSRSPKLTVPSLGSTQSARLRSIQKTARKPWDGRGGGDLEACEADGFVPGRLAAT